MTTALPGGSELEPSDEWELNWTAAIKALQDDLKREKDVVKRLRIAGVICELLGVKSWREGNVE